MSVLLATDGSADAWTAQRLLGLWPIRQREPVYVVTVVPTPPALLTAMQPHPTPSATLVDAATRITEDTVAALGADGIRAEPHVLFGDPTDELITLAERQEVGLILIGAQGVSRIRRFLLGSVTQRVVRHAPCSVLVVREPARSLASLLVATDGSSSADDAISALLRLFNPGDHDAHVISVVPPADSVVGGVDPVTYAGLRDRLAEMRQEEVAVADAMVEQAAEQLRSMVANVTAESSVGDPVQRIVAVAEERGDDLIVVGSRGRSLVATVMLGSVAEGVVREAHCSILVGRP